MKIFLSFIFVLMAWPLLLISQIPQAIPYQGVARNAAGNIIASQSISLRFTLLEGSAAGSMVYQETHNVTTSSLGLFDVKITAGTPTGVFNPLAWQLLAAAGVFLQVEMDINGGTAYTNMGTTQLLSVPFALYAEKSGSATGAVSYAGAWNASSNSPSLVSSAGTKGFYYVVSNAGNTALDGIDDWGTGDWAIYNGSVWQKVDNSEAPVAAADVAFSPAPAISSTNVQDAIEEVHVAKVNRSGDTMTGDLILNANPAAALGAATKQYVDNGDAALQTQINTKVNRSGDTMTGDLILNADPTMALGAATKKYVDDAGATKADKVSGAIAGHFAVLSATGNLSDGGDKSASNISFVPDSAIASTNVQDAIEEVNGQFSNLIDSYVHKVDDGITIYPVPLTSHKRFGIGDIAPVCPLGIRAQTGDDDKQISMTSQDGTRKWNINLNPTAGNVPGFSIDDMSSGSGTSRLFIQESTGYIGIGTTVPNEKLHIEDASLSGLTGMKMLNTASVANQGWMMGHLQQATAERDGSFSVMEETAVGDAERMIIRSGGNVGINEPVPDTKLHVSRPSADPQAAVNLSKGSGIVLVGSSSENHLAMDYRGIQARQGFFPGSTLTTAVSLDIQPLGGGVIIHGSAMAPNRIIIDGDGNMGLGKNPVEKLDINGALTVGDSYSSTPAEGTIRWHADPGGSDLQVYKGGAWKSLTTQAVTDGFGPAGTDKITYNASYAKVGIGVITPTAALHVEDNTPVAAGSIGAIISNTSSTSSALQGDSRIGLMVNCSGTWSSNTSAKNIGIFVSDVSGQSSSNSNIAAVLNGNTVIGGITSTGMVGSNGSNVLAIQNGTAPTSAIGGPGVSGGGIQLYSENDAIGISTFHVKNGDGTVIKLFRSSTLTAPNNNPVSTTTYGLTESDVINNLRTRINELELKLQALGLLQ